MRSPKRSPPPNVRRGSISDIFRFPEKKELPLPSRRVQSRKILRFGCSRFKNAVMTELNPQDVLGKLLSAAKAAGAEAADAVLAESAATSVSFRLGKLEEVERAETLDLGLRVFTGGQVAIVSTTDLSPDSLAALPERALAMARLAPVDPYARLAPPDRLAQGWPDLDLVDGQEPSADTLVARAHTAEDAARAVVGVTNTEGASASFARGTVSLATSDGFFGRHGGTHHGVGVSVLAGTGDDMQRDYDYADKRFGADLPAPETIGRRAGERAVARLNGRKVKSQSVPVVFAPRVSYTLLGHLAGAISGAAIARAVSFLKDDLGKPVFAPGVAVVDDPAVRRGLRSKPFDGEGVACSALNVVEDGVLRTWLLDCATAGKIGTVTNGRAARGTASPPSPCPTNLFMKAGALSPLELIADIAQGFYVVELMGMGVNAVTGDYSRGAAGFWIENGCIAYPVDEVTIAGNLKNMFRTLIPADDLELRYGTDAPTVRIEEMTVAGL
jgi:PmbA protein